MLTIAHADRGRPTLKDNERFRKGLVRELDNRTLMCTRSNLNNRTLMCTRSNLCLHVLLNRSNLCLNVSLNCAGKCCSNAANGRTNNIDEVKGKHAVVILLIPEETRHIIKVTVIFLITFIACIVYCDVIQNKVDAIQQFIVSYISNMYFIYDQDYAVHSHILPNESGNMLPSYNPVSLDILPVNETPKCSGSVQVIVDVNKSKTLHTTNKRRSRYAKFIAIEVKYKRHVGRRHREPSRIPCKKLSRLLTKIRKIRKLVRKHIKKNVPRSSHIHRLMYAFSCERKRLLNDQGNYFIRKHKSTIQKRLKNRETVKHVFRRSTPMSSILNKLVANYQTDFLTFTPVINFVKIQNNIDTEEHSLPYVINSPCMTVNYNFAKYEQFCVSDKKLLMSGDIELNPGPVQNKNNQAFITLPSYVRVEQRLQHFQLRPFDVGGAGDCFFRAVSHQLYGDPGRHLDIRAAGIAYMRENPERFIESNTEYSWLQYLNSMSIQGTWCDGLIIQAVADQLNLRIVIAESHEHFGQFNMIRAVSSTQRPTDIYLGHIDEYHYVSTLPYSSISRSTEEPRVKQNKNEHMREYMRSKCSTLGALCKERKNQYIEGCEIMFYYSICFSTVQSCNCWNDQTLSAISEHAM